MKSPNPLSPRRSRVAITLSVSAAAALLASSCWKDLSEDCAYLHQCDDAAQGGSGGPGGQSGGTEAGGEPNGGMAPLSGGSAGNASGGAGGEGGQAMGGEGGNDGCDTTLSPSAAPCLVSEKHAFFVAPTGSDNAEGTRSAPVKTIAKAVELAATNGKNVILCNATYDEALNIISGARLYGGFACPDDPALEPWSYHAETHAVVAPSSPGVALHIENVADEVVIEDLEFDAHDATTPSESSIAAVVTGSSNATLRRVKLVAGKGAAGENGAGGEQGASSAIATSAQKGRDAACGDGAPESLEGGRWPSESKCGSRGGPGGSSKKELDGDPGTAGDPRTNVSPAGVNNRGPEGMLGSTPPASSTPGGDGSPGSPGNVGASGTAASAIGTFSATGYTPATSGGDGKPGFPGQGGGGGGASSAALGSGCIGASGGAGGMGGCGGTGGTGGKSGGASIALLSFDSNITLDSCELQASDAGSGGSGGNGGLGGAGKDGADGGLATEDGAILHAGKGGKGGDGGYGGPGAGGSGGPSYALVYRGARPQYDSSSKLDFGKGGKAGQGGTASSVAGSIAAPNGTAGLSGKTFVIQ